MLVQYEDLVRNVVLYVEGPWRVQYGGSGYVVWLRARERRLRETSYRCSVRYYLVRYLVLATGKITIKISI